MARRWGSHDGAGRWATMRLIAAFAMVSCGDDGSGSTTAGDSTPAGTTGLATDDGTPVSTGRDDDGRATTSTDGGSTTDVTDPDGSGSGSTGEDSTGPGVEPCPDGHVCFELPGVFHEADRANPTATYDIDLPTGMDFRIIEVELDFTHGGWYPDDPSGLHNIFWLHRGTFADFTWMGGVAGYVNTRGPGSNIVRTRHDLDVLDLADSHNFNVNNVQLQPGSTYHVLYRYDTEAALVHVELTENGEVVAQGNDVPTTDLVRNTEDAFFIYFGNGTDVAAPGPEVPSLGWVYADLRVELIP